MSEIIKRREDLCKINMKFLYYNCIGTYYNNKKNMLNIHNDNYDNNLKYSSYHAMEAYRILDFLERYKYFIQSNAEHPFLLAINYFEDKEKQELLNIKNGIYSLSQITSILDTKIKQTKTICEDFYLSYEEDKELMQWLNNKIKQMIKENI